MLLFWSMEVPDHKLQRCAGRNGNYAPQVPHGLRTDLTGTVVSDDSGTLKVF